MIAVLFAQRSWVDPGRLRRAREVGEKRVAEQKKRAAEAVKLDRDRMLARWQIDLSGMAAAATFFGAGAAFVEVFGP